MKSRARIAAVVLAAGQGRRFDSKGHAAKAAALLHGVPLVRIVAMMARGSGADCVIVVSGQDHAAVETALGGLDVRIVHNASFADGMASSLIAGLEALPTNADGMLVLLADMPLVKRETLDALITRIEAQREACDAVVPTYQSARGNPVLIGKRMFPAVKLLRGDKGARELLSAPELVVDLCEVDDPGIAIDVDTRAALKAISRDA